MRSSVVAGQYSWWQASAGLQGVPVAKGLWGLLGGSVAGGREQR
jgi:hypothetical protein